MVIPASVNQIHGGAQLVRLVLTSINALVIKTLHEALAQPDGFPGLRVSPLGDAGALKKLAGNSRVPSMASCLPPEVFLGFAVKRSPGSLAGEGRRERSRSAERAAVALGVLGTQTACWAMNN